MIRLRWLVGVIAGTLLLIALSPTSASACGISYQEGTPATGCGGAAPVVGSAVVWSGAVAVVAAMAALSYTRGSMSAGGLTSLLQALPTTPAAMPPPQPALPVGRAGRSLRQVMNTRGKKRARRGEALVQESWDAEPQEYLNVPTISKPGYPVTAPGGRFVDAMFRQLNGRMIGLEVKTYGYFRTVKLGRGRLRIDPGGVRLNSTIRQQVNKDVALRGPDFEPMWVFLGAGPAADLRQYLIDARIIFIEFGRPR